jgi:hypothetical protein
VRFNDTRFRLNAPDDVRPSEGRTRREIIAAFRAYQVQFIDRLRQANGIDLARARVRMPARGWLRIPLGSAFALVVAHAKRHLEQAKRVIEADDFPAG